MGCGNTPIEEVRESRPIAGDTVTPILLPGNTWKQNGPVLLSVRLQVQNEKESESRLLQLEDIPYKTVPTVDLTFYKEEQQLLLMEDVSLTRDC